MAVAKFIPPMLLLPSGKALPEGWQYELKLDGYRAIAFKAGGRVSLRSRNDNDFTSRYASVAAALEGLPDQTVVDGELVALDSSGRPSFNALQNSGAVVFYVFDLMVLNGEDVMAEPLIRRRQLLEERVLPRLTEPVRYSSAFWVPLPSLIESVRAQGLEGIVAKDPNSAYQPGQRSGAWQKLRLNRTAQFLIGGYTLGNPFDALVIGRQDGDQLLYVGRVRSGFTSALRLQVARLFAELQTPDCPFGNLPEARAGRWGDGLTAQKMVACRWLTPVVAGEFEFVEETADGHLRHVSFVRLVKS